MLALAAAGRAQWTERGSPGGVGTLITTAHWTRRTALLLAVTIALAVFVTMGATPASAKNGRKTLISDEFGLEGGQSGDMDGREPDEGQRNSRWAVELGDWYIIGDEGGTVVERSTEPLGIASDKRVKSRRQETREKARQSGG